MERENSDNTYTVDLFMDDMTFMPVPPDFGEDHVRTNVPRDAIFFVEANYESDIYLKNAFRHYIQIPEDMMSDAWKNKKKSKTSGSVFDKDEL